MTKITITETPLSKPSVRGPMPTGEIVWSLVIEVDEETCWDFYSAQLKAAEFMQKRAQLLETGGVL